jgi:AcrR family transcriptional regulator
VFLIVMMAKVAERRRGAELEAALLAAAWQELAALGYSRFTIEGVAARAGTSRPVIYRRWANRHDLALAALKAQFGTQSGDVPDMGSLRAELIVLLSGFSERRTEVVVVIMQQMGEFFAETGEAFQEVRREILAGRRMVFDDILERAVRRGEIDGKKLTPRVRALPGDLLRHELLMTLKPVPRKVIEEIVDQVFLPLVRQEHQPE